jgi:ATP-dependent Clp protease, protease subunit
LINLKRAIYWFGGVEVSDVEKKLKEILALFHEDSNEMITLFVGSGGGSCLAGYAFYDFMKASGIPLRTIAMGNCDSIAIIVFLAGKERFISPSTTMLFHQSRPNLDYVKSSPSTEVKELGEIYRLIDKTYDRIVVKECDGKLEGSDAKKMRVEGKAISAGMAVRYGLAHKIWR